MTDDPWEGIAAPTASAAINARRVDPALAWGFFWARDLKGRYLLVLRHGDEPLPRGRLPRLKGIEIESVAAANGGTDCMLVLALLDPGQRDLFQRLCRDIVASTAAAGSEREAVEVMLARTWRWHHLLRGGSDGRLSRDEQRGLLGELLTMERYLLPHLRPSGAIAAWQGPLGAPKDFEVGRTCIEVKARRGGATPFVVVNSEHQLDETGTDALFLSVLELDQAPFQAERAFSLPAVVSRVRQSVVDAEPAAVDLFDARLFATGFRFDDDYADSLWVEGAAHVFLVTGEFPRISSGTLRPGISGVKYAIGLNACEPFLVSSDVLHKALCGEKDAA